MSRYISESLRQKIAIRANYCCEYCKISENDTFYGFQIDHIISMKHGGQSNYENFAYACFLCNSNKGSDIGTILLPNKKYVPLFNPRIDIWEEHFYLEIGFFYAQTDIGEGTIKILKLNDIDRIIERQEEI